MCIRDRCGLCPSAGAVGQHQRPARDDPSVMLDGPPLTPGLGVADHPERIPVWPRPCHDHGVGVVGTPRVLAGHLNALGLTFGAWGGYHVATSSPARSGMGPGPVGAETLAGSLSFLISIPRAATGMVTVTVAWPVSRTCFSALLSVVPTHLQGGSVMQCADVWRITRTLLYGVGGATLPSAARRRWRSVARSGWHSRRRCTRRQRGEGRGGRGRSTGP